MTLKSMQWSDYSSLWWHSQADNRGTPASAFLRGKIPGVLCPRAPYVAKEGESGNLWFTCVQNSIFQWAVLRSEDAELWLCNIAIFYLNVNFVDAQGLQGFKAFLFFFTVSVASHEPHLLSCKNPRELEVKWWTFAWMTYSISMAIYTAGGRIKLVHVSVGYVR